MASIGINIHRIDLEMLTVERHMNGGTHWLFVDLGPIDFNVFGDAVTLDALVVALSNPVVVTSDP